MELFGLFIGTTYPLIFVLVFLCLLTIYYRFGYAPFFYFSSQGIPGPKPKPFIGSLDLIKKFEGNTVTMYTHLVKTYGPVCGTYFGTRPFLIVTDLDMIKDITIKLFDKFADRANSAAGLKVTVGGKQYDSVFAIPYDDWRKRRHFLSPAFSAHKMKLMDPLIKESTVRLAENLSEVTEKEVEILTWV